MGKMVDASGHLAAGHRNHHRSPGAWDAALRAAS